MEIPLESAVLLAAGLLIGAAGWPLFRISARVIGLILGAGTGYILALVLSRSLASHVPDSWESWGMLLVTVLFGVLGTVLIRFLVKTSLFVGGLLFGVLVVSAWQGTLSNVEDAGSLTTVVEHLSAWSLGAGILSGVVFVFFEKAFVILFTAAVGAALLTTPLNLPREGFYVVLLAGTMAQLWLSRGKRAERMEVVESRPART